jgi:lactoylglutathione lyase
MDLRCEIFPADLGATVKFYVEVLGFEVVADRREEVPPYMAFKRGRVRIGALGVSGEVVTESRRPPSGVELVLEVDDLEAEFEQVVASGWPIEEGLSDQAWGLRDFRILDPSGYYLRITNRAPHSSRRD